MAARSSGLRPWGQVSAGGRALDITHPQADPAWSPGCGVGPAAEMPREVPWEVGERQPPARPAPAHTGQHMPGCWKGLAWGTLPAAPAAVVPAPGSQTAWALPPPPCPMGSGRALEAGLDS